MSTVQFIMLNQSESYQFPLWNHLQLFLMALDHTHIPLSLAFKAPVICILWPHSSSISIPTVAHTCGYCIPALLLLSTSLYIWTSPCTQTNLFKSYLFSRVGIKYCFLKKNFSIPQVMLSPASLNLPHFPWHLLWSALSATYLSYLLYNFHSVNIY